MLSLLVRFQVLASYILVGYHLLHVDKRPLSCAADKYADGCSVPAAIPAPFKSEFTPACNRHDICYGCGYHYNWTRAACDEAFYKNMNIICDHLRLRRSLFDYLTNLWENFKLGSTRNQCLTAAKIYYEGVHLFGGSHFDKRDHDYCLSRCANKHGNPKFNVPMY